jgi:hypothetical protein
VDSNDLWPLIEFMANQPEMVDEVLAAHQPGKHGDCIGCGGVSRPKWPCVHYHCGVLAKALLDRQESYRREHSQHERDRLEAIRQDNARAATGLKSVPKR